MKKLLVYLKEYRIQSVVAPLFKLLEVVFDLAVPFIIKHIINQGISSSDSSVLIRDFGILILLAVLGLACSVTAQYFAANASVGFASNLREALFGHIQKLSYKEYDEIGSSTLITRLTSDINQIQTGLNLALRLLLRSPFIVAGSIVMAFTIDTKCGLIFLAVLPVLSVIVFGIMLVCIPLYKKVQSALDTVLQKARDNLTGVRVIRAFRKEQDEIREFDEANQSLTGLSLRVGRISSLMNPLTYVFINIAAVLLIRQGAVQVSLGNLLQGDVVALYNYMAQILVELIKFANLMITIDKSLACASRVSSVLEMTPSVKYPDKPFQPFLRPSSEAVCFEDVSFAYREDTDSVLSGIDFTVQRGMTVGIIGATGSGKSTVADLICRHYEPTDGMVYLYGYNVCMYTPEQINHMIGIVPQKAVLFAGTVRENMKVGNEDADDEMIWKALELAEAKEFIDAKEGKLDFMIEQGGRNLSGGQRQRLAIARALVKEPGILILDDSSSALDYATDARLRKNLRSLDFSPTVFIISQRISSIRDADVILVLDDGKLAGTGSHRKLLASCPVYRQIYKSQTASEAKTKKTAEVSL